MRFDIFSISDSSSALYVNGLRVYTRPAGVETDDPLQVGRLLSAQLGGSCSCVTLLVANDWLVVDDYIRSLPEFAAYWK